MKHEVFILGGQRIDQKSKKDGREARGNDEREKREDSEREQIGHREKRKRQKDNSKMRA